MTPGLGDITSGEGGIDSEFGGGGGGGGGSDDDTDTSTDDNPNRIEGGLGAIDDDDFDSGGTIEDDAGQDTSDGTSDTGGSDSGSDDNPNRIEGGLGGIDDEDFDDSGTIRDDVGESDDDSDSGGDSGPQTPQGAPPDPESGPSPDTDSDGPGQPDFDGSGPLSGVDGTTSFEETRVEDTDNLEFDDEGTVVIDPTRADSGLEDQSLTEAETQSEIEQTQRANRLEQQAIAGTGIDESDVRVLERGSGELVVRPTADFESQQRQRVAEQLGISQEGVQVDVTDQFQTRSELTSQGQQAVAEREAQDSRLSPTGINVTEQGGVSADPFAVRELAREDIEQQAEQQYGVDATPGEDFTVSRQNGEFVADFTDQYERRVAQARREELRRIRENTVTPASPRTGQDGQTELFIEDIPEGNLQNTSQRRTPTQSTAAPGSFNRESLDTDEDIAESITTGGLLAEEGDGGFLPSEEQLRNVSREYQQGLDVVSTGTGEVVDEILTLGSADFGDNELETRTGKVTSTATRLAGSPGDVPGLALTAETGVEATEGVLKESFDVNLEDESEPVLEFDQPLQTAETAAALGARTTDTALRAGANYVFEKPYRALGALIGGAAVSVAGGVAAGKATRFASQRVRTVGSDTFDIESGQIVNRETGDFYNPDADTPEEAFTSTQGGRFPGAQDPTLYRSDPARAVRQQARDYTPESVETRYQQAGVTEGTTLKKTLDVEPDSPGARRVGGFATQAGSYESPGGFVGPEFSPNFLGSTGRQSTLSLRPGLPDTGDRSTGVLVRTRVDEPDAGDMDEFNQELLDREGETTARTKPASEVNVGEAEAVIPPEAEFADIGGRGPISSVARRAGIGSDYSVRFGGYNVPFTDRKIGGKKVPLRPVADPDLIESRSLRGRFRDFVSDERGQVAARSDVDADVETRQLSEIRRPMQQATDRPLPAYPTASPESEPAGDGVSEEVSEPGRDRPQADSPGAGYGSGERPGPSISDGLSGGSGLSVSDPSGGYSVPGISPPSIGPGGGSGPGDPNTPGTSTPPTTPPSEPPSTPPNTPPSRPPTTPPNKPPRFPDLDIDRDDEEEESGAIGAKSPTLYDFRNPLSGEVLVTDPDVAGSSDDDGWFQL